MFRQLLVAFDGSSHAQRALSDAVDLAQTNRARLTVITVTPEPSVWAFSGYGSPVAVDRLGEQLEHEYQRLLDDAIATVPADLPVTKILKCGAIGHATSTKPTAAATTCSSSAHAGAENCARCCSGALAATSSRPATFRSLWSARALDGARRRLLRVVRPHPARRSSPEDDVGHARPACMASATRRWPSGDRCAEPHRREVGAGAPGRALRAGLECKERRTQAGRPRCWSS